MYIRNNMVFEWGEKKNAYNKSKHKLGFELVHEFEWDSAVILDRYRAKDDEHRYAAVNYFQGKLHTIIFTKRNENTRIISFRRSNRSEEKNYEKYQKAQTQTS